MDGRLMPVILFLSTWGCLLGTASGIIFTRYPRNTASLAGTTTLLECEFDITGSAPDTVEWLLLTGLTPIRISLDANISSDVADRGGELKYNVNMSSEENIRAFDLQVNNTESIDDEYHQCRSFRENVRHAALILILEDRAACGTTGDVLSYGMRELTLYEYDEVNLTCQVPYTARWSPLVSWSGYGEWHETGDAGDGLASSELATGPLDASYDGQIFSCKVNFTDPPDGAIEDGEGYDQTVPDYKDFCNITLNIVFSVRNIHLDRDLEIEPPSVNDTVVCKAKGNPAPEITWTRDEGIGEADVDGPVMRVTEEMAGETHIYNCTATNQIGNTTHVVQMSFIFSVESLPVEATTALPTTEPTAASATTDRTRQTSFPSSTAVDVSPTEALTLEPAGLPAWAIALIVVLALILLGGIIGFITVKMHRYRKRTKQGKAHINKGDSKHSQPPSTPTEFIPHATFGDNIVEKAEEDDGVQNPGYRDGNHHVEDPALNGAPPNGYVAYNDPSSSHPNKEDGSIYMYDPKVLGTEEDRQSDAAKDNRNQNNFASYDDIKVDYSKNSTLKHDNPVPSASTKDVTVDVIEPPTNFSF